MTIETRFFDSDPLTGAKTLYHFDHAANTFSFEERVDVEPLIDANRRQHNDSTDRRWQGDMHKVASLPLQIWFQLKGQGIIDDPKRLKKWLNDPENAAFRTRGGKV